MITKNSTKKRKSRGQKGRVMSSVTSLCRHIDVAVRRRHDRASYERRCSTSYIRKIPTSIIIRRRILTSKQCLIAMSVTSYRQHEPTSYRRIMTSYGDVYTTPYTMTLDVFGSWQKESPMTLSFRRRVRRCYIIVLQRRLNVGVFRGPIAQEIFFRTSFFAMFK